MNFRTIFLLLMVWIILYQDAAFAVKFSDPGAVKNDGSVIALLKNLKKVPGVVDTAVKKDGNGKYYILVKHHNLRSILYKKLKIMASARNEWSAAWRSPAPGQIVLTSNESYNLVGKGSVSQFDDFMEEIKQKYPMGLGAEKLDKLIETIDSDSSFDLKTKFSELPGIQGVQVSLSPNGYVQFIISFSNAMGNLAAIFKKINSLSDMASEKWREVSEDWYVVLRESGKPAFISMADSLNTTVESSGRKILEMKQKSRYNQTGIENNFIGSYSATIPTGCEEGPCLQRDLLNSFYSDAVKYKYLNAYIPLRRPATLLRVASFNVFGWESYHSKPESHYEAVIRFDPDIVGVQEAIFSKTPEEFSSYPFTEGCEAIKDFGNILYSRYPLTDVLKYALATPKRLDHPRCVIFATVETPLGPVQVANTHLDVFDESGKTRVDQLKLIGDIFSRIKKKSVPQILLGDLNSLNREELTEEKYQRIIASDLSRKITTSFSETVTIKEFGFRDSFRQVLQPAPDASVWSGRRVDYLFSKGPLEPYGLYVYFTNASDHFPVIVDFKAKGTPVSKIQSSPKVGRVYLPEPEATYPYSEFGDHLYAVHTTSYFPAGEIKNEFEKPERGVNFVLHWALGEMVRPHAGGSWEDKKFAVITKLKNLEPYLLNVGTYDTMTLGSFPITRKTWVVVPESWYQKNTELYNSKVANGYIYEDKFPLRSAVETVISSRYLKGWKVRMYEGKNAYFDRADFRGKNINSYKFFKPLIDKRPVLSFGDDLESVKGNFYCFALVNMMMMQTFTKISSREDVSLVEYSRSELEVLLKLTEYCSKKMIGDVTSRYFGEDSMTFFRKKMKYVAFLSKYIKKEMDLRKTGYTIFHPDVQSQLFAKTYNAIVSGDPDTIIESLATGKQKYGVPEETQNSINMETYSELVGPLSPGDKKLFEKSNSELKSKVEKGSRVVKLSFKGISYIRTVRCIKNYKSLAIGRNFLLKGYCRKSINKDHSVNIGRDDTVMVESFTPVSDVL